MTPVQKSIKGLAIALAIVIICAIASFIISILNFVVETFTPKSNNLAEPESYMFSDVDILDIDLGSANLDIMEGATFKVEVSNSKYLKVTNKSNIVRIKEKSGFFFDDFSGSVKVYVPKDELSRLSIDMGAGQVTIADIASKSFDLEHGAGYISIKNSIFDKSDIEGGAGKIDVSNSTLRNLSLEAGVGKTTITNSKILGRNEISAGVGSIYLSVAMPIEEYTIKAEKGIGTLKINNEDFSGNFGTGANRLEIDGGVGDITVEFAKS